MHPVQRMKPIKLRSDRMNRIWCSPSATQYDNLVIDIKLHNNHTSHDEVVAL